MKSIFAHGLFVLITFVSCYTAGPACLAGEEDGNFDIYWVDVEGGASTLMVTSTGESILIDSGNPGRRDPNRIVHVATQIAKIRKIDHLITTHYHKDHFGGASLLATLMPVGIVYDNGRFEGMPDNPGAEYFELPCDRRVVVNPGDHLTLKQKASGPQVSVRCLATRQTFVEASSENTDNAMHCADCQPKDRDGSDNANSLVTVIQFGDFRFFDGGDLTWNQEMRLVCPKDLVGKVDVYQVTHHGLDSSNNPVVLKTLQPRVAVMNNGDQKGCLPEVFANLKTTASLQAIFQMHKNLRPDGSLNNVEDTHIANHEPSPECSGHYIHLSVQADSSSYTVSIPSQGTNKTFQTTRK